MDKILVSVYVPIIKESYDIFIPRCVQIYDVLELIKKAITELSEDRFISNNSTVLCNKKDGQVIDINKSADELGITNGSKLMLI